MHSRFLALTLIWGASFLFIKIGVEALAPMQVAFGRMFFGARHAARHFARAPRAPAARAARLGAPVRRRHARQLRCRSRSSPTPSAPSSSALASIGNATVPLFTLLFALLLLPSERPTLRRGLGLAVGFVGVLLVLGAWRGLTTSPDTPGMLLILIAAASYGASGVYMRRYLSTTSYSSLALSAGQIGVGALQLASCCRSPRSMPRAPAAAVVACGLRARRLRHRHRLRALLRAHPHRRRHHHVDGDLLHPHRVDRSLASSASAKSWRGTRPSAPPSSSPAPCYRAISRPSPS